VVKELASVSVALSVRSSVALLSPVAPMSVAGSADPSVAVASNGVRTLAGHPALRAGVLPGPVPLVPGRRRVVRRGPEGLRATARDDSCLQAAPARVHRPS